MITGLKTKKDTIRIPEDLFSSFFTEEERRAVGAHELAHLLVQVQEIGPQKISDFRGRFNDTKSAPGGKGHRSQSPGD